MCLANENRRNRQQNVRKRCKKNTKTTVFFQYELVKNQNSTKSVTKKKKKQNFCCVWHVLHDSLAFLWRFNAVFARTQLQHCVFVLDFTLKMTENAFVELKNSLRKASNMRRICCSTDSTETEMNGVPREAHSQLQRITAQPHGFVLDAKCWRNWRITECTWRGAALVRAQEGGVNARCTVVVTVT